MRVIVCDEGDDAVEIDAPGNDDEVCACRGTGTITSGGEKKKRDVELGTVEEVGQGEESDEQ